MQVEDRPGTRAVSGATVEHPVKGTLTGVSAEWTSYINASGRLCGRITVTGDGRPFHSNWWCWEYRDGGERWQGPHCLGRWQEWPAWVDDLMREWPLLASIAPEYARSAAPADWHYTAPRT